MDNIPYIYSPVRFTPLVMVIDQEDRKGLLKQLAAGENKSYLYLSLSLCLYAYICLFSYVYLVKRSGFQEEFHIQYQSKVWTHFQF